MARTKKFQELINKVPEAGTDLIDLWKWIIRNHFDDTTICPDPSQRKIIVQCKYTRKKHENIRLYLYIFTKQVIYYPFFDIVESIEEYFKYEKKHETAPIIFKETSEMIERRLIKYFIMVIYDPEHKESVKIDF